MDKSSPAQEGGVGQPMFPNSLRTLTEEVFDVQLFFMRRNGNGNERRGRGLTLSDLPPLDAVYIDRARVLAGRRPARDCRNVVGVARPAARLSRAARAWSFAWRVTFYLILAAWCGLVYGLLLHEILMWTRR